MTATSSSATPYGPFIASAPANAHLRSPRGELVPVRLWRPAAPPRRIVVALHGLVTHAGWFAQLGELLAARGVAVVAPDRRGNGAARGLGGAADAELLIADVHAAIRLARRIGDDLTLLAWCGSANLALPAALSAAAAGAEIQRLMLASPGLVPRAELAARFAATEPIDGFLPIHFDPASDFTDDAATQAAIRGDALYLRDVPLALRATWRQLNVRARQALAELRLPIGCALTSTDRMIDLAATEALLAGRPLHRAPGGHGFVVEPAGAAFLAELLAVEAW